MRIPVSHDDSGEPTFGAPDEVMRFTPGWGVRDVSPIETAAGMRFLTIAIESGAASGRLNIVLHADELLREALAH